MKLSMFFALSGSLILLTACSANPDSTTSPITQAPQAAPANDDCKDFPIALYPSRTSVSCSQDGDRYTASIETNDTIDQVTQFYQTQVQSSGWEKDPEPLITPKHTVVRLRKGSGHVVISTFLGQDDKGCSFQINAFPKGNP